MATRLHRLNLPPAPAKTSAPQYKVQGLGPDAIKQITLDGTPLTTRLVGSIQDQINLTRTISGQTTLTITVNDPGRVLLPGLRGNDLADNKQPIDLEFDDMWFRLIQISKLGDSFTLTFGDREVELLKRYHERARASRGNTTLAEFIQRQFQKAAPHMQFVCPDLHDRGKIHDIGTANHKKLDEANRNPGIPYGSPVTVKGQKVTRTQVDILNIALNECETIGKSGGATERVARAIICACIGESTVSYAKASENPPNFDHVGPWQGQIANGFKPTDAQPQAHSFLVGGRGFAPDPGGAIGLAKANPNMDPGTIATKVEGSGANGSFYGKYEDEAKAIIKAYGGITVDPNALGTHDQFVKQTVYSQGPPTGPAGEDAWTMAQRYADLVQRRVFIVAGVAFYINDWDLIRNAPRMRITESSPGVDSIDYDVSARAVKPDEVTIECRAHGTQAQVLRGVGNAWAAPPGTVVALEVGTAFIDGAWIVGTIERPDITEDTVTITLVKPHKQAPEPAAVVATKSQLTMDGGINTGDVAAPAANSAGYVNPFSKMADNLTVGRVDMGVDYGGKGEIISMTNGMVTNVSCPGWEGIGSIPTFIEVTITNGAYAGKHMYYAESIRPAVTKGQHIKAGDKIGDMVPTSAGAAVELGWSTGGGGRTLAKELGQDGRTAGLNDPGTGSSAAGCSFNRFLVSTGCPAGTIQAGGELKRGQPMPSGYP